MSMNFCHEIIQEKRFTHRLGVAIGNALFRWAENSKKSHSKESKLKK